MKLTVKEIRAALYGLPDNLEVEFSPITAAWLGTSYPMRFEDVHFYNDAGDHTMPDEAGAKVTIHLVEDRKNRGKK